MSGLVPNMLTRSASRNCQATSKAGPEATQQLAPLAEPETTIATGAQHCRLLLVLLAEQVVASWTADRGPPQRMDPAGELDAAHRCFPA